MKVPDKAGNTFLIVDQGNTLTKVALYLNNELKWISSFNQFTDAEVNELLKITSDDSAGISNIASDDSAGVTKISSDEPAGVSNLVGNESAGVSYTPGDIATGVKSSPGTTALSTVTAGIISSVKGDPEEITRLFNNSIKWTILDHNTPVPILNKYATPETLGKDRLAAVVGAYYMYPGKDVLVIDAGTAITYDFINKDKEYFGGSISPGLTMRFKALHTFTGKLPLYDVTPYNELSGNDTTRAIISGVMNGARLEMDGFIGEYALKYPSMITILTGGDAIYFDKKLKSDIFAIPNLVLNGLNLILLYNFEK